MVEPAADGAAAQQAGSERFLLQRGQALFYSQFYRRDRRSCGSAVDSRRHCHKTAHKQSYARKRHHRCPPQDAGPIDKIASYMTAH